MAPVVAAVFVIVGTFSAVIMFKGSWDKGVVYEINITDLEDSMKEKESLTK
jgi:hypothetical protein